MEVILIRKLACITVCDGVHNHLQELNSFDANINSQKHTWFFRCKLEFCQAQTRFFWCKLEHSETQTWFFRCRLEFSKKRKPEFSEMRNWFFRRKLEFSEMPSCLKLEFSETQTWYLIHLNNACLFSRCKPEFHKTQTWIYKYIQVCIESMESIESMSLIQSPSYVLCL